jgi:hypothetical protein
MPKCAKSFRIENFLSITLEKMKNRLEIAEPKKSPAF